MATKMPASQKTDRIVDDKGLVHNEGVDVRNNELFLHALKFGSFDGYLSIVFTRNE